MFTTLFIIPYFYDSKLKDTPTFCRMFCQTKICCFFSLHQLSCSSFTLDLSVVRFLIILFFTFLDFKGRL